jgi:hypothetical protein
MASITGPNLSSRGPSLAPSAQPSDVLSRTRELFSNVRKVDFSEYDFEAIEEALYQEEPQQVPQSKGLKGVEGGDNEKVLYAREPGQVPQSQISQSLLSRVSKLFW